MRAISRNVVGWKRKFSDSDMMTYIFSAVGLRGFPTPAPASRVFGKADFYLSMHSLELHSSAELIRGTSFRHQTDQQMYDERQSSLLKFSDETSFGKKGHRKSLPLGLVD